MAVSEENLYFELGTTMSFVWDLETVYLCFSWKESLQYFKLSRHNSNFSNLPSKFAAFMLTFHSFTHQKLRNMFAIGSNGANIPKQKEIYDFL